MFNVQQYLTEYVHLLHRLDSVSLERAAELVVNAWTADRTVYFCGNGGSAASATHIATDLVKLTMPSGGRRLRAVSLAGNVSAMSAIANDISYDEVFAEQLRAFARRGDLVVGLSTSGSSPNVLRAIEYANSIDAFTLGITGSRGARLRDLAMHSIVIDSANIQHVEDATMVAGHMLCLRVRDALQALQRRSPQPTRRVPAVVLPVHRPVPTPN